MIQPSLIVEILVCVPAVSAVDISQYSILLFWRLSIECELQSNMNTLQIHS